MTRTSHHIAISANESRDRQPEGQEDMPEPIAQRVAETVPPRIPRGMDLLDTPLLNKGTAFTEEERTLFGLLGLLPPHVETLEEQVVRAYEAYQRKNDDLERHIYLRALQDTNEVLFYRLLLDHIEEMMPTVALACQQFSHIYRRPRAYHRSDVFREENPLSFRDRRAGQCAAEKSSPPHRKVRIGLFADDSRADVIGRRRQWSKIHGSPELPIRNRAESMHAATPASLIRRADYGLGFSVCENAGRACREAQHPRSAR
jgi:hypothetical protein